MSRVPEIVTYDYEFEVKTGNSNQNSALLIYKITIQIDTLRRRIELKGYQAVNKKYQDSFKIKVKGFSKADLDSYEFYWIDPDHKDNILIIKKLKTNTNSDGLIKCLLQPGLLYLCIQKSMREEFNSLIKSCTARTDPAAETKSIGLQADAHGVMVFAIKTISS